MIKSKIIEFENFHIDSAQYISDHINLILGKKNHLNIAISGGKTPLPVLNELSSMKIDFKRINFFIVDERDCPNESNYSNYYNLKRYFFDFIPSKFFYYDHNNKKTIIAQNYQNLVEKYVSKKNSIPCFDLILLGMGDDGHTASIFPNSKILNERNKLVAHDYVDVLNSYRFTFTLPLIMNANKIFVLIRGSKKYELICNLNDSLPIKKVIDNFEDIKILCSRI